MSQWASTTRQWSASLRLRRAPPPAPPHAQVRKTAYTGCSFGTKVATVHHLTLEHYPQHPVPLPSHFAGGEVAFLAPCAAWRGKRARHRHNARYLPRGGRMCDAIRQGLRPGGRESRVGQADRGRRGRPLFVTRYWQRFSLRRQRPGGGGGSGGREAERQGIPTHHTWGVPRPRKTCLWPRSEGMPGLGIALGMSLEEL